MGGCNSLGLLKSFLSYASPLSGANSLHFHILNSSLLTVQSGCSLMAVRLQVLFSFLSALRAQKSTFGGPELLMAGTSLFTDMVGTHYFSVGTFFFGLQIIMYKRGRAVWMNRAIESVLELGTDDICHSSPRQGWSALLARPAGVYFFLSIISKLHNWPKGSNWRLIKTSLPGHTGESLYAHGCYDFVTLLVEFKDV